jgi:hypothetical protein
VLNGPSARPPEALGPFLFTSRKSKCLSVSRQNKDLVPKLTAAQEITPYKGRIGRGEVMNTISAHCSAGQPARNGRALINRFSGWYSSHRWLTP